MDGFSRMVIWLHAYSTNSDPKVIASYFILIRSDLGTENRYVEQMQKFLRYMTMTNMQKTASSMVDPGGVVTYVWVIYKLFLITHLVLIFLVFHKVTGFRLFVFLLS